MALREHGQLVTDKRPKKIVGDAMTESDMFQSEKARALEASILDNLKKTTCKCRR